MGIDDISSFFINEAHFFVHRDCGETFSVDENATVFKLRIDNEVALCIDKTALVVLHHHGGVFVKVAYGFELRVDDIFAFLVDISPFVARLEGSDACFVEIADIVELRVDDVSALLVDESPFLFVVSHCGQPVAETVYVGKLRIDDHVAFLIHESPFGLVVVVECVEGRQSFLEAAHAFGHGELEFDVAVPVNTGGVTALFHHKGQSFVENGGLTILGRNLVVAFFVDETIFSFLICYESQSVVEPCGI